MTKVNKNKCLIAFISVLIVLVVGTYLLQGLSLRQSSRNKVTQIVNEEAIRVEDITASVGNQETTDESAEAGGEQSDSAYREAYKSRLLLKYTHERNPENLLVIDELVETIQATSYTDFVRRFTRCLDC